MKRKSVLLWLALVMMISGPLLGCQSRPAPQNQEALEPRVEAEAWQILTQEYLYANQIKEDIRPKELTREALKAAVRTLGDPLAAYLTPAEYTLWKESRLNTLEGIGLSLTTDRGQLVLLAPVSGSPAEKAGLKRGDLVLEVEGVPTSSLTPVEASLRIRGPAGSPVRLVVQSPPEPQLRLVEIVRQKMDVSTVETQFLKENKIGYMRIKGFMAWTGNEFSDALVRLRRQGPRGIILDLRGNPGGLLEPAVAVASHFLSQGVVTYELNNKGERRPWKVGRAGYARDLPLAVVVDKETAGVAEALAAALKEGGQAQLFGHLTKGQANLDRVWLLEDGSALILPSATLLTPRGNLIQDNGVAPHVSREPLPSEKAAGADVPLKDALQYITYLPR